VLASASQGLLIRDAIIASCGLTSTIIPLLYDCGRALIGVYYDRNVHASRLKQLIVDVWKDNIADIYGDVAKDIKDQYTILRERWDNGITLD
jgi:hypothetical protein